MREFHMGIKARNERKTIFHIEMHKTREFHGSAMIALDKPELVLLEAYVSIRNQFVTIESESVFLNWTGASMSNTHTGTAMTQAFKCAGLEKTVTATRIRKMGVNAVHSDRPDARETLAKQMNHSMKMALNNYRYNDREKLCARSNDFLKELHIRLSTL